MAYAYEQATMKRQPPSTAPMIEGDYVGFGDFDGDGRLSVTDIDLLSAAIRSGEHAAEFDITGDGQVDQSDLREFVLSRQRLNSVFGDADGNGWFDSSDLIQVFKAAEYDDGIDGNSTWSTGDWNADGEFDSEDLTLAFQEGGYSRFSRPGAIAVPEPTSLALLLVGITSLLHIRSRVARKR